jgi:hypothetical protein
MVLSLANVTTAWAGDDPESLDAVGPGTKPALVVLGAPWCQWCKVLEAEVLPAREVRAVLRRRYRVLHVDVDQHPTWMDLPGVNGLPALIFVDRQGRHVLTRTGYRPVPDMVDVLTAVSDKIDAGTAKPYPRAGARAWDTSPITPDRASVEFERLRSAVWLKMDSNKGGFGAPSHDPRPEMLTEMEPHAGEGRAFARRWIELTVDNSLRGGSPRLRGEPTADMDFAPVELRRLSQRGKRAGRRWREGVERLPTADAYLGLQDPWDGGVFRYAAGPGWYHPHFERRASDNMAWALTLRQMGRDEDARRIMAFVEATFSDGTLLNAAQSSDPFYFRLTQEERRGLPAPAVARLWTLEVQARGARLWPARCAALERVDPGSWPRAHWTARGVDARSPPAPPDAVGELLLALAGCPELRDRGRQLTETVISRWRKGLPDNGRLHRLAAGICAASPDQCGAALATVEGLALDLEHAPPLVALGTVAGR